MNARDKLLPCTCGGNFIKENTDEIEKKRAKKEAKRRKK